MSVFGDGHFFTRLLSLLAFFCGGGREGGCAYSHTDGTYHQPPPPFSYAVVRMREISVEHHASFTVHKKEGGARTLPHTHTKLQLASRLAAMLRNFFRVALFLVAVTLHYHPTYALCADETDCSARCNPGTQLQTLLVTDVVSLAEVWRRQLCEFYAELRDWRLTAARCGLLELPEIGQYLFLEFRVQYIPNSATQCRLCILYMQNLYN